MFSLPRLNMAGATCLGFETKDAPLINRHVIADHQLRMLLVISALLIVGDHLRSSFADFKPITYFLQTRSKRLNLLLLLCNRRPQIFL